MDNSPNLLNPPPNIPAIRYKLYVYNNKLDIQLMLNLKSDCDWIAMLVNGSLFHLGMVLGKMSIKMYHLKADNDRILVCDKILWRIVWQVEVNLMVNILVRNV